ncbi:unnamed protein product [Sympodiomycopsis kandeliae]
MPPKKGNKMSLNDFLADEATGSWADDVDDLPISSQPRYPGDSNRRGGDYLASMPDRADRDRMAAGGDRPLATPYTGAGAGGASFDRGAAGPPRQDVPLPDKPPFTAFLGSLSFDVSEGDVADFFAPHNTVSVRIVTDRDGRPKGFGYVEFETLDALKDALAKSGASLAGRPVRVGVAEPPKSTSDRPGFGPSVAEEASQWRRAGPLPPSANDGPSSRPGMGGRERSSQRGFAGPEGSAGGPSGFDNMEVGAGGRSGFGTKYQASPAGAGAGRDGLSPRGPPREPREPLEPSKGEVASDWRTGKPMEARTSRPGGFRSGSARFGGEGQQEEGGAASGSRNTSATDVDEKYSSQERMGFGSKHVPTPESPSGQRGGRGSFERRGSGTGAGAGASSAAAAGGDSAENWRSARGNKGATSPLSGHAQAAGAPAPAMERKKLDLKPRSTSSSDKPAGSTSESSPSSSKASPFGNARPVDQSSRQKAIEERLEKERQERAAEEAARKAEKEKAVKDAPTGPRADREKQSEQPQPSNATNNATAATTAAATGPKATPPTGAWGGGRVASGALAAKQQKEREEKEAALAKENKTTNGAASVEEVTSGVEKSAITNE